MAPYSEVLLQEILQQTDLVKLIGERVALRHSGRRYLGLCPFHQEKTPSFSVDPDKQMFYCFGCQTGGTAFTFVQKLENLSFPEAVEYLAERAGVRLPTPGDTGAEDAQTRLRRRLFDACAAALTFFREQLSVHPEAGKARRFSVRRELSPETMELFQLGYAPPDWRGLAENLQIGGFGLDILEVAGLVVRQAEQHYYDRFRDRLIFPIFDARGRCIAFGGRQLDEEPDQPKYLNSPQTPIFDKSQTLYGLHLLRNQKPTEIVLCEGYLDLISMRQAGVTGVVASLGTALTKEHAALIKRYSDRVILCYDSDTAGQHASERGMFLLQRAGLEVRIASCSPSKDPDEYIRQYGQDAFRSKVIEGALPLLRFCKDLLGKSYDLQSIEGKSTFVREFLTILSQSATPIEEEAYLREIAEELQVTFEALRRERQRVPSSPRRGSSDLVIAAFAQTNRAYNDPEARTPRSGLLPQRRPTREAPPGQEASSPKDSIPDAVNAAETLVKASEHKLAVPHQGRIQAEENLLAIALVDSRFAVRLKETVSPDHFALPEHRLLAERLWQEPDAESGSATTETSLPAANSSIEHSLGAASDPTLAALLARLHFLEGSLVSRRETAFSESLIYLKAEILRSELATLGERSLQLQDSGDEQSLQEVVQQMQEIHRQIANLRNGA